MKVYKNNTNIFTKAIKETKVNDSSHKRTLNRDGLNDRNKNYTVGGINSMLLEITLKTCNRFFFEFLIL